MKLDRKRHVGPRDPQEVAGSGLFLITPNQKLPRRPSVMDGAQTLEDSQNGKLPSREMNKLPITTTTGVNLKDAG